MNVRIVTDSTAHLAPELITELNITVIPLGVQIGNDRYLDGLRTVGVAIVLHFSKSQTGQKAVLGDCAQVRR